MLRTNLSTRPFYNERVVHLGLVVAAALAVVVLAAGGLRLQMLAEEHAELVVRAGADEAAAREIQTATTMLQQTVTAAEVAALTIETRDANRLIDRRVFSWTECFNVIEATLPDDVILTSLRPASDEDGVRLTIGILGRSQGAIGGFADGLERTGAFADVLVRDEEMTDEGSYRAVLEGVYLGAGRREAGAVPPGDAEGAPRV